MRIPSLAALICLWAAAVSAASTRVYEGGKTILTGPYDEKAPPEDRPEAFSPVQYPAVFIENDYLRCCLLPTVGGRIYEVYHKPTETQAFRASRYLETHDAHGASSHEWNLGGLEINFPYLGQANTYNDRWQWAPIDNGRDAAGIVMARTSRRTLQRVVFRVVLPSDSARLDLHYRFENLSPFPWGLAGWINVAPASSPGSRWLLPPEWVTRHAPGRAPEPHFWSPQPGPPAGPALETLTRDHARPLPGRAAFLGIHDPATQQGLVRVYDPATLPVFKLAARAAAGPELRARADSETASLTDGLWRRPELSAHEAAESWYPIWGIDGCVLANRDLALHVDRPPRGKRAGPDILLGVCASRNLEDCAISLRSEHEVLYHTTFDLDPAKPWKKLVPALPGPVFVEIVAPGGQTLARYELRQLPSPPRPEPPPAGEIDALEDARHEELLEALDRRPDRFLEDSIGVYTKLLSESPRDASLMVDLARAYLRDAQLRAAARDPEEGPPAANLRKAHDLLRDVLKRYRRNDRARFYLGLALEGLGKPAHAAGEYRAAQMGALASPAGGLYLAHTVITKSARDAVDAALAAARAYPQSVRVRHMLMAALAAAGKPKEAVAIGRGLYDLDPADPLTTHLLSASLKAAGEPREAAGFEAETTRLLGDDEVARRGFDRDIDWLYGRDVRW